MSLEEIIQNEPAFRRQQIYLAWFDKNIHSFDEITTLSKDLRAQLKDEPWLTVKEKILQTSKIDGTRKALLELSDGKIVETVLMPRANKKQAPSDKPRYTICVSSQVGCPMACTFCATGKMGFTRNLTYREIIDQIRYWKQILWQDQTGDVDNVVFMGQGEPLLNYENVKLALNILIKGAKLGPRKITVSTVGLEPTMNKMVDDKNFPPIRFALSLHSAINENRTAIMPSNRSNFLDFLVDWSRRYHQAFPSRTHFIGIEYIMLKNVNDTPKNLEALSKLALKMGSVRVNLIPYNPGASKDAFGGTDMETIKHWQQKLNSKGIVCTIRRSQGLDIAAACGQLANKNQ
jgi:23S rRNA (adenine2503-C2)-methyltransferase